MSTAAILSLVSALVAGVPKIIAAVKAGRDPKDIKLSDFISTDALDEVRAANKRVDDYVNEG